MDRLKQYEKTLFRFKNTEYANITLKDKSELLSIYKELYPKGVCTRCSQRWLVVLANAYFNYLQTKTEDKPVKKHKSKTVD